MNRSRAVSPLLSLPSLSDDALHLITWLIACEDYTSIVLWATTCTQFHALAQKLHAKCCHMRRHIGGALLTTSPGRGLQLELQCQMDKIAGDERNTRLCVQVWLPSEALRLLLHSNGQPGGVVAVVRYKPKQVWFKLVTTSVHGCILQYTLVRRGKDVRYTHFEASSQRISVCDSIYRRNSHSIIECTRFHPNGGIVPNYPPAHPASMTCSLLYYCKRVCEGVKGVRITNCSV